MTELVSAKEAHNQSKYKSKANEILKNAAMHIKEAIDIGDFYCHVPIFAGITDNEYGAIELAMKTLTTLGYTVKFEKDEGKPSERYYDSLNISWEELE